MNPDKKIKQITELPSLLKALKENDEMFVLCHGVFDLLHIGHIKYFQEAKSMGDILVVTVTPDRFVNKGPGRPAFDEIHRAEAIAALDVVDYVAINEWPTAIETIKALQPNLYVKGPDYKNFKEDITGNIQLEQDAVKSIGGKMAFTSDVKFSSSSLINERILRLNDKQKKFVDNLKTKYNLKKISESIESLKNLKVLLVGEIIIDEYVFCNSIGKSGKEPVLVNQKISAEKYAGGILAVANHISDFCKSGMVLTYLGEKDDQKAFIDNNLSENIKLDTIIKGNSPTILKTRYIDNYTKNKMIGVYDLNDDILNKNEEKRLNDKLIKCIDDYDLVVVVDYGHGLITPRIVDTLEKHSKYLAVNTQLNSFNMGYHTISKYTKADYVCVHEGELRHDYRNRHDTFKHLTKQLANRIKSQVITITRGNAGSTIYKDGKFLESPAFAGKVVDRVGAGDTLLAITALCFAAGIPEDLSLFYGNLSAAQTVASTGTGNKLNKVNLTKAIQALMK
jgi:rfaE bifunctional protein kinase chain/domain/rfaE bifunctional protein nucleotidyltransferase chain/domain